MRSTTLVLRLAICSDRVKNPDGGDDDGCDFTFLGENETSLSPSDSELIANIRKPVEVNG